MKFYDIETEKTVTLDELREIYENDNTLREEYETFTIYVKCCMTSEGGTLEIIREEMK